MRPNEVERAIAKAMVLHGHSAQAEQALDRVRFELELTGVVIAAAAGRRETSRQAAVAVDPRRGTHRHRVLREIRRARTKGATDDELQDRVKLPHQSVSARRCELEAGGFVEDSGSRRVTRHGRRAIVWVATVKGKQVRL